MRIEIKQAKTQEKQMIELNKALKKLKKKLDREGVFTVLRQKKYFIKPSELKHQVEMKRRHEKRKKKRYGKKR